MDSKDPHIHVLDRWMPAQKHTQHAPSTKMECDYLNGWIKKWSHTQKSHPKWWTPEILLGNTEVYMEKMSGGGERGEGEKGVQR